ncbi:hypothetical protein MSAN_01502200 [Mycena sanguinolenta]|uniref:Uncharacterized protein n=1 Tax=Mycena sanguinolenta TaxID=230812 RepID=A0A8H6Y5R7_9AGAR|nr:hypothetical protein MSAN_01502200 [Mycena sanguinolenta]
MVCQLSFFPNVNYLNDSDHDKNTRKFWFLVFSRGLYTKKTDADAAAEDDDGIAAGDIKTALTKRRMTTTAMLIATPTTTLRRLLLARGVLAQHARATATFPATRSQAATAPVKHKRDPEGKKTIQMEPKPAARSVCKPVARTVCKPVAKVDHAVKGGLPKPKAVSVPPKRANSAPIHPRVQVKHLPSTPKVPLYVDTDDSDDENIFATDSSAEVSLAAARAKSRAQSALSSLPGGRRCTDAARPGACLAHHHLGLVAVRHLRRAFCVLIYFWTQPFSWPSAHLLYNRRTCVLYNNPQDGVDEMALGDSMAVVERREVKQWMATLGN